MSQALLDESGRLIVDLHGTLSEIDPARWRAEKAEEARSKIQSICARLADLVSARWPKQTEALRVRLATLREHLERELPDEHGTAARTGSRWVAFRAAVTPAYEALSRKLREYEINAPTLRPTNYTRTVFHLVSAVVAIAILYSVPEPIWGLAISLPLLIWAWTVETLRRSHPRMNALVMKAFAPIAHPYEYNRINSATWYVTGVFLLNLTMSPLIAGIGLAVLGTGDPMSGLVGRKWGRVKIMHGRSLEGSLAFVAVAIPAALLAGWLFAPTLPVMTLLALSLSAALAGAVAEMVSVHVDDNLSIGVISAASAALMASALGVSVF